MDRLRRAENREVVRVGGERLKNGKHLWQRRPENLTRRQQLKFAVVPGGLRVARARAIKQMAANLRGHRFLGRVNRIEEHEVCWVNDAIRTETSGNNSKEALQDSKK